MIIHSDWHIHSEYSYDAKNTLEEIAEGAIKQGLRYVGITDHANMNDKKFIGDLHTSVDGVKRAQEKYPFMVLGVELTPIAKPMFDHIARTGTLDGYVVTDPTNNGIELAASKEELKVLGVRYAIGASHWVLKNFDASDLKGISGEWYRQQMWLACDERVTVLGHPWYIGTGLWYDDFSVIPHSMSADIFAALKENGKYIECNSHFFHITRPEKTKNSDKFAHQYAEFLREAFEMGIPVTYGSDSHINYGDSRQKVEECLAAAGFVDGDISEIAEKDLW